MAWIKIGTKTTDATGKVTFDKLPPGNYRYGQTSTKTGYTVDPVQYDVTVSTATPIVETKTNTPAAVGSLQLTKFSDGYPDLKLAGGRFKLMDTAGKTMLTQSAATDASGLLTFTNLMSINGTPQNYKVVEVVAPTGYDINAQEVSTDISVNVMATSAVANTPTTNGQLDVNLSDTNYSEYSLAGSNYDIYIDRP
ncbi:MAG: SpaA isopeptide-forming pilin-related protein [Oscillospiraceae bacterium]